MAGPALIAHATEKQKRAHLPRILSADHIFCQGFSEPNAGSDLAAVQTRAERKNGYYVINGQKVWTSYAHYANWCILLTRTDPKAPKHNGLTFFVVDMASPGFIVKPLRQMSGDAEFNELYFDNLEVPAENVVGRENGGWAVAITTLMFERGPRALSRQLILRQGIAELLELAKSQGRARDSVVRQRLAQAYIEAEVLRYANLRILTRMIQGGEPGPEGSVSKLFFSETWQRGAGAWTGAAGALRGALAGKRARGGGRMVAVPGAALSGRHHCGRHLRDHEEHPRRAGPRPPQGLSRLRPTALRAGAPRIRRPRSPRGSAVRTRTTTA